VAVSSFRRKVTGSILLLLGAGFALWGARVIADAWATKSWPSVSGRIVESRVDTYEDSTGGETMYTTRLRYQYLVNDARHSGSSIGLLDHSSSSLHEMSRLAERFPAGAEVAVYYDPRDPRTALLEPGPALLSFAPLLFGLLALLVGALAWPRAGRHGR
jgi:hypothetical protein